MPIKRIDHIAIVVDDIDASLVFWEDALGLKLSHLEDAKDQESLVAFLPSGESEVELVEPTSESSGVARYLAKRGPGVHHICFEVDDIRMALARLKRHGVQLINEQPTIGTGGKQIAFIHPKSTGGVLVELYQLTPDEPRRRSKIIRDMRRRLVVQGYVAGAGLREFIRVWRGRDGLRRKVETPDEKLRIN
ncbi:MAG TPA: methylmalonyl-CoA epimerase [Anaerolineae bacterium]|nr:methylmalonyl-CoA epimerase [Anaerolineae bacterium]